MIVSIMNALSRILIAAFWLVSMAAMHGESALIPAEKKPEIAPPEERYQSSLSETIPALKEQELRSQLGQFVELDVHIEQVSTPRNGNVYLNIGGSFPNAILTLIIFKNNLSAFGDVDIKPGHNLRVKGRLTEYKGSLQIILQNRQQVVRYDK